MIHPIVRWWCRCITVSLFLHATVVPKIVEPIIQMGQELPSIDTIFISIEWIYSELTNYCCWPLVWLVFLWRPRWKSRAFVWVGDRKLLSIPLIGKIAKRINTSRFARAFYLYISAIPILKGWRSRWCYVKSSCETAQVLQASDSVREGASLRKALDQTKLFPPMMLHMIASGEQSGQLEQMLTRRQTTKTKALSRQLISPSYLYPSPYRVDGRLSAVFIVMATLMPMLEMNNLMSG